MKVHRYFGPGFPEVVYKSSLMIELIKIGISFKEKVERDIIYEGRTIHKRRPGLIVEDVVLVELKAIKEVDNSETSQVLNYLRVFKIEVGLLLNFGVPSLFFKRYIHTVSN